jgi:hypothetical protein
VVVVVERDEEEDVNGKRNGEKWRRVGVMKLEAEAVRKWEGRNGDGNEHLSLREGKAREGIHLAGFHLIFDGRLK